MNAGGSDEPEKLKIENIINYINSAQQEVSELLSKCLEEDKISIEKYYEIKRLNEEVSQNLLDAVRQKMSTYNDFIRDLLAQYESKEFHRIGPMTEWEEIKVIIDFIVASSHLDKIQRFASKIREAYLKAKGLDLPWVPSILYDVDYLREFMKRNSLDPHEVAYIFRQYAGVARAVQEKVLSMIRYSEEPDDIIRMADKTLELGFGDCDDRTVLICSLWRALNFHVCLGVTQGHIMPAIILPSIELVEDDVRLKNIFKDKEGRRYKIIHVIVPNDHVKLWGEITYYDLLNFDSKPRNFFKHLVSILLLTGDLNKLKEIMKNEGEKLAEELLLKKSKELEKARRRLLQEAREAYGFLKKLEDSHTKFRYYPVPPVTGLELDNCIHLDMLEDISDIIIALKDFVKGGR
ncbi:MAG: hypothetical protein DRP00_04495 [Candidatus Aenigmatarchaeota archaeon]|nr:MAG: hypothetical protein DRP00_04495 [Candidatus Aenigmarchaeota archaeon]